MVITVLCVSILTARVRSSERHSRPSVMFVKPARRSNAIAGENALRQNPYADSPFKSELLQQIWVKKYRTLLDRKMISGHKLFVQCDKCRDGETGRRAGLKIRWEQSLGGSIPPPGTRKNQGFAFKSQTFFIDCHEERKNCVFEMEIKAITGRKTPQMLARHTHLRTARLRLLMK